MTDRPGSKTVLVVDDSRFFRTLLYADPAVARAMREGFVLHWQSVRPAPRTETVSPESLPIASVSRPCTETPSACTCQPTNGVPSYSSVTR